MAEEAIFCLHFLPVACAKTTSDRSLGRDCRQISKFSAQRFVITVADLLSQSISRGGDRLENNRSGSPKYRELTKKPSEHFWRLCCFNTLEYSDRFCSDKMVFDHILRVALENLTGSVSQNENMGIGSHHPRNCHYHIHRFCKYVGRGRGGYR